MSSVHSSRTMNKTVLRCCNFFFLAIVIWVTYYVLQTCGLFIFDNDRIKIGLLNRFNILDKTDIPPRRWTGCPTPGGGLNSILISSGFHGRLGNIIWEYLSAWAIARHYDVWPVVPKNSLHELKTVFQDLSVPSMEDLAFRCNFSAADLDKAVQGVGSQERLLSLIENPRDPLNFLRLPVYVVHTEEVLPWWRELRREMRLLPELKEEAQNTLQALRREMILKQAQLNVTAAISMNMSTTSNPTLEFVGVHVRRTDYLSHVVNNYPGARAADERYFLNAMQWLRNKLKLPLIFVVVSDDLTWCYEHFQKPDVFVIGTGNQSSPGSDLALLAACNHTIFSYGTFGLSAAMLANGRFTLLYDTQNNTNSKEMEFANYLPGWHILDDEGKERYKPYNPSFKFTYAKG